MHEDMMRLALFEAQKAFDAGEVPVGAVLAREGRVIAAAHNHMLRDGDATAHAEMLILRQAGARLSGATLYVTLEPCPMCAGAIALARPDAVIFGAHDPACGCCGSVYRITEDPALGLAAVPAHGGVLAAECAALLKRFFQERRTRKETTR